MNATTLTAARFRLEDSIMATARAVNVTALPPLLLDDKVMNRMYAKLTVAAELALTEIFRRYVALCTRRGVSFSAVQPHCDCVCVVCS